MRNVNKKTYHQHVLISIQKIKKIHKNLETLHYIGSFAKFAGAKLKLLHYFLTFLK